MKFPNVTKALTTVKKFTVKHTPEILTGIGIAGMVTTTVLAVKATPKALVLIEEKKKEEQKEKLTAVETVQATWKCYIPAAAVSLTSAACLIGASATNYKRNAALTAAYQLTKTTLEDYRGKVVEVVGEKKEHEIRDKIAQDKVKENPVQNNTIVMTGNGNSLIYDSLSGRYFESSIEKIRKAQNDLNGQMIDGDMYVSLNEFYNEIGIPDTQMGEEMGWTVNKRIDISFSSTIADDGRPCLVLDYFVPPFYDFKDFYGDY